MFIAEQRACMAEPRSRCDKVGLCVQLRAALVGVCESPTPRS